MHKKTNPQIEQTLQGQLNESQFLYLVNQSIFLHFRLPHKIVVIILCTCSCWIFTFPRSITMLIYFNNSHPPPTPRNQLLEGDVNQQRLLEKVTCWEHITVDIVININRRTSTCWLAGWLAYSFAGWLVGCRAGWLVVSRASWLVNWLVGGLVGWLTRWLVVWLAGWLAVWLV